MTCIIGLVENERVYIGGDSLLNYEKYSQSVKRQKVFIKNGILFGCSGPAKSVQHFRFKFNIPEQTPAESDLKYLCFSFVESLSKTFKSAEIHSQYFPPMLAGFNGKLYKIHDDLIVTESADNFDACGDGSALAMGAMKALCEHSKLTAELKIREALKIAAYFKRTVQEPFDIISI